MAKVREQLFAPEYKSRRFLIRFLSRAILYDIFIVSGQDRARRFMGAVTFIRGHETDAITTMPAFVPKLVCTPYHFDIKRNRQGYWIARDRGGLAGGTFLTRKDAVHFALFEAGLVFRRGNPPYATYLFKHALVQDTAYGTLLRGPREALHGRAMVRIW